jgi:hypothetical protein
MEITAPIMEKPPSLNRVSLTPAMMEDVRELSAYEHEEPVQFVRKAVAARIRVVRKKKLKHEAEQIALKRAIEQP